MARSDPIFRCPAHYRMREESMSRIVLLLITFWAATVGLIGGVAPDLLAARPENATDVVEKDVRGLTRVRIATSGVLSGGEAEGWIDVEGEVDSNIKKEAPVLRPIIRID